LPVRGSGTQWYQNLLNNPSLRIDAGGVGASFQAVPVTDPAQVSAVVEKFRKKYGAGDVKKYYATFDAAVVVNAGGKAK